MAGTKRRSVRQAQTRKRSIYAEPETDDDFDFNGEQDYEPPAPQSLESPHKRRKLATRSRPTTRSKTESRIKSKVKSKSRKEGRRFVIGKPRKLRGLVEPPTKGFTGPSDKKIPPWNTLPIAILREIFIYAALPIQEQTAGSSAHASWLLKTARLCRAFAVPALEAYYLSPSFVNHFQPHELLELLQSPPQGRYMNYNSKIRSLLIDVRRLAYTATHRGLFDLSRLVAQLPQLQHLEVLHPMHTPPFRPLNIQKWSYPANLFDTIAASGQRLKSWRWNRDMIVERDPATMYTNMLQLHSSRVFQYLERLTVCGFAFGDSAEPPMPEAENAVAPAGLATSIAVLPSLKDVSFISCDMIMEKFLERLPRTLSRLELTNCLEMTSEMLRGFFVESGTHLKVLELNHNPALNLTFLVGLKMACPQLEILKMDLRYFSERVNSNDAEPLYDQLLLPDEIPTWPSSLQHLELVQLQRWSREAAETLFASLLDNAEQLPNLQTLVLQAHIDIPWRDRAGFREQWIDRLRRVFLRRDKPPVPYLGSLRQFALWQRAHSKSSVPSSQGVQPVLASEVSNARHSFSHVEISPPKPQDTEVIKYTSSQESPQAKPDSPAPRRSRRVAETQLIRATSMSAASPSSRLETSVADSSENSDSNVDDSDGDREPEKFVQGLCTVVDIRIDNQRPRENQFTEGDFLDSEASGDEDWREGMDEDDGEGGGYAW